MAGFRATVNRPTSVFFFTELEPPVLAPPVLVLPAAELELVTFPSLAEQPATAWMATVKNTKGWENPSQPRLFIANPSNAAATL